jgi:hypothetical protein
MERIQQQQQQQEKEEEEKKNDEIYISNSKQNIDTFIKKNDYRRAFGLLLTVLDRLDDGKQKNDFISHYLNDFFSLKHMDSHLNPM